MDEPREPACSGQCPRCRAVLTDADLAQASDHPMCLRCAAFHAGLKVAQERMGFHFGA
jgi:hypothetical protein